jgi:AraC-like DNA-binding protein
MWMNELWSIGLTGAAVAGAVGWPLVRRSSASVETAVSVRVLGAMLLLAGLAAAIIAATHGRLITSNAARAGEHFLNGGDLVFWAVLLIWFRGATSLRTTPAAAALLIVAPLAAYVSYVAWVGDAPRFIWLLPAGMLSSATVMTTWLRRRGSCSPADRALLSRMALFAIALNGAQTIRTLWPEEVLVREIVPITMTAGFLSLAALGMRGLFSSGTSPAEPRASYAKSALDRAAAERLMDEIDRGMHDGRWYRDPRLSLAALAARIGARPHQVSQAINQLRQRTLMDYLAGFRMAEARRLLEDPASDKFTIDALAEAAGFASRSAFYKAFKAHEGQTPTAYRARVRGRMASDFGEAKGSTADVE